MTDERNKTITLEGGHEVDHGLHRAWRREISFHLVRGLCYLLAFASGLVLLGLCVDWLLWLAGSPPYAPAALLVVGTGVLIWVAYRCWRQLRLFDALREALRVEQANPDINSLLVSSVQLREDESDAGGVSADLIRIVRREAAARSATIHFERIVSFRSLRGIIIVAIVVMAVVASVGVFRSAFLWTFARRMFNPLADIAYPTSTRIDVLSGNLTVRKASPVTLRARAEGQVPEKGLLYVRIGSAGWEKVDLSREDGDEFRFAFEQAHQNIDYYFRVGDAKSGTYRVTVEAPPRIVESHVDLRYPQYTRMPPQELSTLNLKLPEGTEVRWRLRTDRPILRAEMIRDDSEPQSMQINEGGLAL